MLPWRRPEPSPEEEGVLWGHLARVGARRRPAQPSFELVYSLSVCQLFRLSRFVPDFDVSGKTAEPKMAFNFAHCPSPAAALRAAWGDCGAPGNVCGARCTHRHTRNTPLSPGSIHYGVLGAGGGHDYAATLYQAH